MSLGVSPDCAVVVVFVFRHEKSALFGIIVLSDLICLRIFKDVDIVLSLF